jgi:hypothetical protein
MPVLLKGKRAGRMPTLQGNEIGVRAEHRRAVVLAYVGTGDIFKRRLPADMCY